MTSPDTVFLNWLLALPFFAAFCAAIFPRFALRPHSELEAESLPRAPFSFAALTCLMGGSIAASLLPSALDGRGATADYWWTSDLYQLRFRADGLSVPVVLVLYALGLLSNLQLYSLGTPAAAHRQAAYLLLVIGSAAVAVLSADVVAMLFFVQLALVSAWLLASTDSPANADRLLKLTFAGSLLLLAGVLVMWHHATSTATYGLSLALLGIAPNALRLIGLLMLVGVAPLLSAFPGHFWLPALSRTAPRAAFTCSALLVTTGLAVALRLLPGSLTLPLVPGFAGLSLGLGLISLAAGILGAWIGRSLRELAAWFTVAQAGHFLIALHVAASPFERAAAPALQAAVIHLLTAPLALLAMWSATLAVLNRTGTDSLPGLSGLLAGLWPAGVAFLLGGLSLAGAPFLPGFWEQRLIVLGLIADQRVVLAATVVAADLLLFALVIGGFRRAFLRGERPPPLAAARRWETMQLLLSAAVVIALGALATPVRTWSESVVRSYLTLLP